MFRPENLGCDTRDRFHPLVTSKAEDVRTDVVCELAGDWKAHQSVFVPCRTTVGYVVVFDLLATMIHVMQELSMLRRDRGTRVGVIDRVETLEARVGGVEIISQEL